MDPEWSRIYCMVSMCFLFRSYMSCFAVFGTRTASTTLQNGVMLELLISACFSVFYFVIFCINYCMSL